MFLKQNIPKFKKVLQTLSITAIAIVCTLTFNTLQTYAYDYSGWVTKAIVDSKGSDGTASVDKVKYGVSTNYTGYLCYLLDANGQKVPGTNAIALKSPGFSYYPGARDWIAESRLGGYVAGEFNGTADWSCTPWTSAGDDSYPTNEPTIRAWFEKEGTDGAQNALIFVRDNWGNVDPNIPHKFGQGEYFLVVETLMHFQYSEKSSGGVTRTAEEVYTSLVNRYTNMPGIAVIAEAPKEIRDDYYDGIIDSTTVKNALIAALTQRYIDDPSSFEIKQAAGWKTIGPCKLVGTPANMIKYRNTVLKSNTNVFNKFTHKIACFAEFIQPGNIGEQIGFKAWTGSTSSQMSDSDVFNHGVAMMVISAKNPVQTTADEPKIPTPHAPAKESDGTYSIVKSYRTKEGTQLTDNGTFSIQNISNEIQIESEQKYQVVGWKVTSTASTSVDSINWNPPGSTQAQGTTASTVTIQDPYKCLYILLEKTEDTPEDYNYKLTESTITRRVHFTAPDHRLTLPYIENHTFKWIIPAHQTSCPGNHPFTDACHGQHVGPHTSSCEKGCPATCTQEHPTGSHIEACSDPHYYDCGTRCQTQYASCSGWQWHERNLKLSINSTQQSNYPDILATKSGWNTEPQNSKLTKHYYLNDSSFERTSTSSQSYSESNWDYVAVLLRGKDKLTVAQWQNAGSGSGLSNSANTDLQGVSSSGFTIANSDSGERIKNKSFYMETFNTYFNTEESDGVDNYTYYQSTTSKSE